MEERRRCKRLDLDVTVQLERLDMEGITTLKYVHVEVNDISKTGIGFISNQDLELGSYYDAKLQIWTKETINALVEIVRREVQEDGTYHYGGVFIGMTETDTLKIEIYQIFNEL